jgi:hypothetical protein
MVLGTVAGVEAEGAEKMVRERVREISKVPA